MALLEGSLGGSEPLAERLALGWASRLRTAAVLRRAGPGAVDGQCARVADPELRGLCSRLEAEITDFVNASNAHGTSVPLGGSRGLRSFRELRFKAQTSLLWGAELRWRVVPEWPLELVAFYELGHAADRLSTFFADSRHSAGGGARYVYGGATLRLEAATGQEGQAAFFTVGLPW